MKTAYSKELLDFIRRGVSPYHVIENFKAMLVENGFAELSEAEKWKISTSGKYFVTRNDSSIIAF